MAQFIRTRVRCEIFPSKVGTLFQSREGSTPKIYKGGACDFEIVFLIDNNNLFDVGNISSVTVMAKASGQPTSAPVMLKTSSDIENIASLDNWKDGVEQQVIVAFSDVEANIAAGNYDLTVFGLTQDDGGLAEKVFGMSTLQVIDVGLTNTVQPAVGPAPALTTDQFNIAMEDFVKKVRRPGDLDIYVSEDEHTRRLVGVGNNKERIDYLEDV